MPTGRVAVAGCFAISIISIIAACGRGASSVPLRKTLCARSPGDTAGAVEQILRRDGVRARIAESNVGAVWRLRGGFDEENSDEYNEVVAECKALAKDADFDHFAKIVRRHRLAKSVRTSLNASGSLAC